MRGARRSLPAYGEGQIETPNIDRLAREGEPGGQELLARAIPCRRGETDEREPGECM